jgi:hypothetical protein
MIEKQLDDAKAVIVVWTLQSIRSNWVISEAERARDQHKLIPVKEPEVQVRDIPMPFGVLHTEDASDYERIARALVDLRGSKPRSRALPVLSDMTMRSLEQMVRDVKREIEDERNNK